MILKLRRRLRNVHFLRSAFHFWRTWRERARWTKESSREDLLSLLKENEDPWNYTNDPVEMDRFKSASNLLEMTRGDRLFENAFEVACSEGVFTNILAPRCKSLLAVDLSEAALSRAKLRCAGREVKFEQWDLFTSPAPKDLDLVVVMDVVEYFLSPSDVRNARDKLVNSLRPGGYLLLGNSRQNDIFETSWWGKWMLRGGQRIAEFFGEHPQLKLVASETKVRCVLALFRKEAEDPHPLPSQGSVTIPV
jgi:hypothetical protein